MSLVYHFTSSIYDITGDEDVRHYALDKACVSHGGEYVLQVLLHHMYKNQNTIDDISYVAKKYIVFSLRRFGYVLSDNEEERRIALNKAITIYGTDCTVERLVSMKTNEIQYLSHLENDISYIKKEYNFVNTKRSFSLKSLLKKLNNATKCFTKTFNNKKNI